MFYVYGFFVKVFEIFVKYKILVDFIIILEISVLLILDKIDILGGVLELFEVVCVELEELCMVEVEYNLCLIVLIGNKMKESCGYVK